MKVIEAYKFIKEYIYIGKKNNFSIYSIDKGIKDFLRILKNENALTDKDILVLELYINKIDDIVNNYITSDEAFAKSMCEAENIDYKISFDIDNNVICKIKNKTMK